MIYLVRGRSIYKKPRLLFRKSVQQQDFEIPRRLIMKRLIHFENHLTFYTTSFQPEILEGEFIGVIKFLYDLKFSNS